MTIEYDDDDDDDDEKPTREENFMVEFQHLDLLVRACVLIIITIALGHARRHQGGVHRSVCVRAQGDAAALCEYMWRKMSCVFRP